MGAGSELKPAVWAAGAWDSRLLPLGLRLRVSTLMLQGRTVPQAPFSFPGRLRHGEGGDTESAVVLLGDCPQNITALCSMRRCTPQTGSIPESGLQAPRRWREAGRLDPITTGGSPAVPAALSNFPHYLKAIRLCGLQESRQGLKVSISK